VFFDKVPLSSYLENFKNKTNTDIENINNELDSAVTTINTHVETEIRTIQQEVATLKGLVGSPLIASSVADMTDKEKIYVYKNNDSTDTNNGKWFYHDGTNWIIGGIYQSDGLDTDKTLLGENMAADAKATGEAIDKLKTQINLSDNQRFINFGKILNNTQIKTRYQYGRYNINGFTDVITTTARNSVAYPAGTYKVSAFAISNRPCLYGTDSSGTWLTENYTLSEYTFTASGKWYMNFYNSAGLSSADIESINNNFVIVLVSTDTIEKKVSDLEDADATLQADIDELSDEIGNISTETPSFNYNPGNYVGGYITPTDGTWTDRAIEASPSYMGTKEFVEIPSDCIFVIHGFAGSSNISLRYAIYDASKNYLDGASVANTDLTVMSNPFTASYFSISNHQAKYIRFSALTSTFSLVKFEIQKGFVPSVYTEYGVSTLSKTQYLPDSAKSELYGSRPINNKAATLTANQYLYLPVVNSLRKNKVYHWYADIDNTFESMKFGHGEGEYSLYWIIDGTNLTFYTNGTAGTVIAHGLTLSTYIDIVLKVGSTGTGDIVINTLGGQYKYTISVVNGYKGSIFLCSTTNALSNAYVSCASPDYVTPIWFFGDSYFTHTSVKRWPYHLIDMGFDKYVLDGYPGANSKAMLPQVFDFVNNYGCPKYLVWCLGMNDKDDTANQTPNADWLECVNLLSDFCEERDIELILAVIPNTPATSTAYCNYYKDTWIKSHDFRYIDFAKAVGAETLNSEWIPGTLDDVCHPTEQGAKLLALQVLKDFPEIELGIG